MFKFKRIANGKRKTSELIVTVKDITDQRRLAFQLEQTEADQKKQIEWMLSILHVEPALLREFMESSKKELEYISKLLKPSGVQINFKTLLQNISRSIHLLKGNASLLDLKFFEVKAHNFEDIIAGILSLPEIKGSDFVSLVIQLEDMRKTMHEINELIDRLGNIHNQFRPKRDYESKMFVKSLINLINNLAKDFEKEVKFDAEEFEAGQIPYQYRLTVKEILVQLIRNSVYHGIEETEERKAKNKQAFGTLKLRCEQINGDLKLIYRDDGRGIQLNKLRESAEKLKLWDPAEIKTWDDESLAQKIFTPGISTSDNTNLLAGRGIGMDAIKQRIDRLDGQICVIFSEGEFCEFDITIPIKKEKIKKVNKAAEYI